MQQPPNVAAAMQQGAPVDPAAQADPAAEADPSQQGNPMGEQDDTPPEEDPAFVEAFNFVRKTLYEDGAADDISKMMTSYPDPVPHLSQLAYDLTSKADGITDGNVLDENLISLGMYTLTEVTEIADASGVELVASDVASAFKSMLLQYLGEQGADTTELQGAMNEISPEQFNELEQKIQGGIEQAPPEEAMPANSVAGQQAGMPV